MAEGEDRTVRLASIVAIDIVGFSTMSEKNQMRAAGAVEALRKRIGDAAVRNGGRIFNTAGDGFMLEFGSAGSAVAMIGELLDKRPKGEPPIRIGAHVGDVVVAANDDLLGHGVNVAARLQSMAAPGAALVSGEFRSMARTSPEAAFRSRGRKPLENIEQKVSTFAILSRKERLRRTLGKVMWGLTGAGATAAAIFGGYVYFKANPVDMASLTTSIASMIGSTDKTSEVARTPAPLTAALPADAARTLATDAAPATPSPSPTLASPAPEEPPRLSPGQTLKDCEACPELIVIPEGKFMMGSPASEPGRFATEGPQREVTIGEIAFGKHEVTFSEWDACLAAGGCSGFSPADRGWGRGRRPVIGVSWNEAQGYVDWLNLKVGKKVYRLPTEAEWEYAARAGSDKAYAFGARLARGQANFNSAKTDPAGSYNANAFGLYDMHGNAWEWVADCYQNTYEGAPTDGAAVDLATCAQRVYRGGGYSDDAASARSANRRRARPDLHDLSLGFRVVRSID